MDDEQFDLFGDPVRLPNGKRGRPAHKATQKNRNKVMMLVALGWSNERIARALFCSLPTLRRYYFSELKARDVQRDRFDAKRFEQVFEQAEAGNVGAMRLLNQMIEKNDLVLQESRIRAAQEAGKKKPAAVGKKEQERRDARQIASGDSESWGDDLNPGIH